MNAERLHAIAVFLKKEISDTKIDGKLQNLINALQNVVNQPAPQHQQALADNIKAVYSALTDAPSDDLSPAWRQLLTEVGGNELFGRPLKTIIENIFSTNQITPAVALTELQQLLKRVNTFKAALDQLTVALRQLNIGDETLSPGQCEIGMLIPRTAVDNHLTEFADELNEISFILNTFSEIGTGKKDNLDIKTISSTDLTVYLNAAAPFAACLAVAIERIVALYRQLLEIRKLRADLQKQGVPAEQTAGIEDYANKLMDNGIEKLSVDIITEFYKGSDDGRKNELSNAARISLDRLATRIDRGYNFEVRVEPLHVDQEQNENQKDLKEQIQKIQAAAKNMEFMKLEGEPILKRIESKEKHKGKKEK
jgi:hypothetical protein